MVYNQATKPTIAICNYTFDGPFQNTDPLKDNGGIYVILDKQSDGWHVIDVGESGQIKSRIDCHDRSEGWKRYSTGNLGVAVLYTPGWSKEQRCSLESKIRQQYNPPCGER